ncbi:chorismate pyruvate-lyase family protein [Herbidospora cretacea]|uniref:chorismate pyruvate-lyase family protein n=1 Tax=Herbidospora cretacea TaxID=28444 RepID=UPI0009ED228A|nr:chorismate pyruvate-lyase family protein [Herbidospora cretacea]
MVLDVTGHEPDSFTLPGLAAGSWRAFEAPVRPVDVASFRSGVTRLLVASDGSTTQLLEASFTGPLSIKVLRQTVTPSVHSTLKDPAQLLGLPAGAPVVSRYSALLDSRGTPVTLNHVVAVPDPDSPMGRIVTDPSYGIGTALASQRIEHRRQLISCGLADWPGALDPASAVVKTYLIWRGERPLMYIRELFNPDHVSAWTYEQPPPVATPDATRVHDYRLGSSDDEKQRLLAQTDLLRPAAAALFERLPLPEGARALDVGCGPLGVLDLMSEAVGPDGWATGLDTDERMIGWARESVAGLGLANVGLVHGGLPSPQVPDEGVDLTHCRLLLINNLRPEELVRAMAAATRPGGWVAAQEFDWASWQCDPPHPAWDRLKALIAEVFGGDVHVGARLPTLLRQAGVTQVRVAAHAYYWRPGDRYQTLLPHFAGLFHDRMVANGACPDTLHALTGALREHLAHEDTVVREALFVQAWGRKGATTRP